MSRCLLALLAVVVVTGLFAEDAAPATDADASALYEAAMASIDDAPAHYDALAHAVRAGSFPAAIRLVDLNHDRRLRSFDTSTEPFTTWRTMSEPRLRGITPRQLVAAIDGLRLYDNMVLPEDQYQAEAARVAGELARDALDHWYMQLVHLSMLTGDDYDQAWEAVYTRVEPILLSERGQHDALVQAAWAEAMALIAWTRAYDSPLHLMASRAQTQLAIDGYTAHGDLARAAFMQLTLSSLLVDEYLGLYDRDAAEAQARQALATFQSLGNDEGVYQAQVALADALLVGHPTPAHITEAVQVSDLAIEWARRANRPFQVALDCRYLAEDLLRVGRIADAVPYAEEAVRLFEALNAAWQLADARANLATILARPGHPGHDPARARVLFDQAIGGFMAEGDVDSVGYAEYLRDSSLPQP